MTEGGQYIVVMGVSGAGKSTIAERLAAAVGGLYLEGDALHPQANVEAMSNGIPLTDEMRHDWLIKVADEARALGEIAGQPVVISCSALKRRYRDLLCARLTGLRFIHLAGDFELIRSRLLERRGHFMPTSLLESQFADLEELERDEPGAVVSIDTYVEEIIEQALRGLREPLVGREGNNAF